ncbi:uncharacterized protein EV422DRAFT_521578 [Fimicolochytrium jonesii]|uniref:uncharacterized protein n=1 Tax=Fimicolochytrium jonesii TaxID=1396493 RepID=UPI0022FE1495|nr:uncharacterized protein EV422DRAFT_521578 [Fimicolochytrium jonesii]KAI8823590.1 hypothetical protein EV422DRAFT_521578 [Fimicolochytrium jonesii]
MPAVDWTIILCILAGAILAPQAGMNGTLGQLGRNKPFASLWSFTTGMVILIIYWLAESHGGKDTDFHATYTDAPWYAHMGGFGGAYYVVMIVYLAPRLGAGTIMSVSVTSQMAAALIFDHYGALGLERRQATAGRIVGLILSAIGVALIMLGNDFFRRKVAQDATITNTEVADERALENSAQGKEQMQNEVVVNHPQVSGPSGPSGPRFDWTVILACLGGICLALQGAMNGKLGQYSGGGYAAAFSFLEGWVIIALLFVYDLYFGPQTPKLEPRWSTREVFRTVPWWAWFGGVMGALYVLAVTVLIPRLGAATVLGTGVCALVISAVICDHFAWFGLPRTPASIARLVGVCILVAGVVMITIL